MSTEPALSAVQPDPDPIAAGDRLLLPARPENQALDLDLFQRYSLTARLLARMLANVPPPMRILELGPNYLNPLLRFLNPELVQLTRCDTRAVFDDPDFVRIDAGAPLPFANEAFDAVVALEVLEHMPRERRRDFLAESLRVARHGGVYSTPHGVPEVIEAEALAAASFLERHGFEHPYLREHREFGLPGEAEIVELLKQLEVPHAVIDNAPLDVWLPMLLLAENLLERQTAAELLQRVNVPFFQGVRAGRPIPYRKIYVVAKSFDATAALDPLPGAALPSAQEPRLPDAITSLHYMATATCDALAGLELDRQRELAAKQNELERTQADVAARERELANLHGQLDVQEAQAAELRAELSARQADLVLWRSQHAMVYSYVQALSESGLWKLLAPLRGLRRTLRPRGFNAQALFPWNQLVQHPRDAGQTWFATGDNAHFIIPCHLPAGWLRLRLKMSSDVLGRGELYFDSGITCSDFVCTDQLCTHRFDVHGKVDLDTYFYLPRPALGVRFKPLDVPGQFHLDRLDIQPLSPPLALLRAVRSKVNALRRYGLVTRALGNGLGMLFRGEFGKVLGKVNGGLEFVTQETAPMPPPPDISGHLMGRRRPISEKLRHQRRMQGTKKLDIVYVLKIAGLCGGVKVVMEHTSRLAARGHNVAIYCLDGQFDWFPWPVSVTKFASVDALKRALADFRGIKVATWYETAPWVAETLQPGDRGYYMVQDIEESYCDTPKKTSEALATYRLGLKPITEGVWVRNQLKERFGLDSTFVSIGLDFELFQPRLVMRDAQRILTQARTWSGGAEAGARLKGWDTAKATILRCRELNPRTTLTTFSMENKHPFPKELSHLHYQLPTDHQLSILYSQAGLYLLTSTHEGFGLTAAEAMACGCPVVATLAQGNEEFCIDGVTALTAPAGDVEQLARKCVQLQNDAKLARELRENGRRYILQYTWDRVIDQLEREYLQQDGPEVIIEPPTPATDSPLPHSSPRGGTGRASELAEPVIQLARVAGNDEDFRSEFHDWAKPSRSGEYPDLHLDEEPSADWTIVIPTIDNATLVRDCIISCRKYLPDKSAVQFVVVDDGTQEPSILRELRRTAKELDFQLVCNHQNLGFSASVNNGMRQARGRYVVLCNSDILFVQPWLEALEQAFTNDPNLGVVGAKLLYPDETIQHAGVDKVPGQLRFHHAYGKQPGDVLPAQQSRYVWCVTGALFAIPRQTLQKLGGMSTAYATAYEDLDYCLNAWMHGERVGYCADVAAYHLEGGTRGATESKKSEYQLWAERERAGGQYFEKKWGFLRHVENFQSLLSFADRRTANGNSRILHSHVEAGSRHSVIRD